VVRARLHDRHLIDGEPLSSNGQDRGRAGCWDRERLNRRSGHQSLAIRAPRVLFKGSRTQQYSTNRGGALPIATCGIDWAQDHHDIAIVDTDGQLLGAASVRSDRVTCVERSSDQFAAVPSRRPCDEPNLTHDLLQFSSRRCGRVQRCSALPRSARARICHSDKRLRRC